MFRPQSTVKLFRNNSNVEFYLDALKTRTPLIFQTINYWYVYFYFQKQELL